MRFYFPESKGQIDAVGYNNAIRLFRKALFNFITDDIGEADYRVYCNLPWHHAPKKLKMGRPLFIYTMYESTRVPSAWVAFLNRYAGVIAVPSEWCRWVFISSGVKRPIGVLSLGIDKSEFDIPPLKVNAGGEYVYLWQGVAYDPGGRKGVDAVTRAYRELRNDGKLVDSRLILKYLPESNTINIDRDGIRCPSGIHYLQRQMTRRELHDLYMTVDCCINPTRGEGFGLIPLEQMAMGKPVIVTDFSIPYIDGRACFPLKYRLDRSPVYWNHRFLKISRNGLAWNMGGLSGSVRLLPKLLNPLPDGGRCVAYPDLPLTWSERIKGKINNLMMRLQRRSGLYYKAGVAGASVYQERTGMDASADVDDLKKKMLWCYKNRDAAEAIGRKAREHVLSNWNLSRMRSDFNNNILPLLEKRP
jgi:hypothetical protein